MRNFQYIIHVYVSLNFMNSGKILWIYFTITKPSKDMIKSQLSLIYIKIWHKSVLCLSVLYLHFLNLICFRPRQTWSKVAKRIDRRFNTEKYVTLDTNDVKSRTPFRPYPFWRVKSAAPFCLISFPDAHSTNKWPGVSAKIRKNHRRAWIRFSRTCTRPSPTVVARNFADSRRPSSAKRACEIDVEEKRGEIGGTAGST